MSSLYEDIPCCGLNVEPVSGDLWYPHLRTFVKCLDRGFFQGGRKNYEHFVTEVIDRTCRIYREAGSFGLDADKARDCQVRQIKAYGF